MKTHIIWHNGIGFCTSYEQANFIAGAEIDEENILFCGKISELPVNIAQSIAEIHPDYHKYYEAAMRPLYKMYNEKTGTEDPRRAVASLKTAKESDYEYVLIWKII